MFDVSWCLYPVPLKKGDMLQLKTHHDHITYQAYVVLPSHYLPFTNSV